MFIVAPAPMALATFVQGWWPHRHHPNVLMIHFADMKKDLKGIVAKIAKFLGMCPLSAG